MENGAHDVGRDWYRKAVERGATVDDVDQDLRRIYFRADPERQAALRAFLLGDDPVRYAWAGKSARSVTRGDLAVPANEQRQRRNAAQRQHPVLRQVQEQRGTAPGQRPGKRKRA